MKSGSLPSSYRDPDGFVFSRNGRIYRQINTSYQPSYGRLMDSGLYAALVKRGQLVPHREVKTEGTKDAYRIVEPELIPVISYPYEWCFGQLKDAAILTLAIQKTAISHGMSLKDASSFNVQFREGKPVFIDTLSFEPYDGSGPWVAYRQFCEQFLAPLAVCAFTDARIGKLTAEYGGSMPLDLAVKLLPFAARFNPGILIHLILHARSQAANSDKPLNTAARSKFGKTSLLALVDSLEQAVRGLRPQPEKTVWTRYADSDIHPSYEAEALEEKKRYVRTFLSMTHSRRVWDIGSNTGVFSRIAAELGIPTVSMDNDHSVVQKNYEMVRKNGETAILPLCGDITNPTPATGWNNDEREPLLTRIGADTVFALAILHHLVLTHNLPFDRIAEMFAAHCTWLVIEFVPREDRQAQLLMQGRDTLFPWYTPETFEAAFAAAFDIRERIRLKKSARILYLMHSK
jgi:hypothetical protein